MYPAHPSPPLCFNVFLSFYAPGTSIPTTLFQRAPVILFTRHIHPHHSVSTYSCPSMYPAHPFPPLCFNVFLSFYAHGTSIPTTLFQRVPVILCTRHILPHHSVSTCFCPSMHPAHPSPPLCFNVFLSFYSPGTSVPTTLFQRVPVLLCTRHIRPHHSVSTCSCHSMHLAHPFPPLCFNVFMSFYAHGTSIPTTLFQRVPVILCTCHIHSHHSVSTCSCHSMHTAHPSPPLCFNVFLSFYAPGTSVPTTLFQRVPVLLFTRHIRPHHSVSTCSCPSMHPAHPSPPLCFNVFLSFYAPGTSIPTTLFQRVHVILCTRHIHPTTLFQRVPVILCTRHIHPHHSVSTCSCHSMHPSHPSPPLCFNVFMSFYAPVTSIPTTLFQRVPVILCTRHIHPHHSVSTCSYHSMNPAHPSPPLCFNMFLSFYVPGTSIPTTLFQRVPVILCTRHIHTHHSVSTCSCHSMHPAHPSPPLCFNVFLSFYVPGTSIPTTLFQRVPVILCTRHIHSHHSVSTCSCHSMHTAHPSPPLCFNVFLSFYAPGTSVPTTLFQRVPVLLFTRHIRPHHSVSTCSCPSMHPAHPSPPLCFNVFLSFYAPGTSIPTTLFQRVHVILCTRHIHPHHSVSTCSCHSMHLSHPLPPLCFNVFLSFYVHGTSIPTTLFQRVSVLLCTRHIRPHHSVSTCSCPSIHPAHPSPPLCFNVFLSFYAPGTSVPTTLFQRVPVILCTWHIHSHHSVSTCSCHSMHPAHPSHHSVSTCSCPSMHPAHPSPPLCFNVFLSFYAPGTSIPTSLFQRVPVILCTRHIHSHHSVSTCSCHSKHTAHPSPPLCFNVLLSFYAPGTSIPTTLFQRVPVILCTRHIHPHHSVSTCSCPSVHPANPFPPLCFNVFLSFYAHGTSIPTTLFQRVPVILCTRHIHSHSVSTCSCNSMHTAHPSHHSVSTCFCPSMHPAHPSPPLCFNVFLSFNSPGTSVPTTLFQRVPVILCTRHIHPHHSVSTCSCHSMHTSAHPFLPLCFNVFLSFYAHGTSIPTTLFQRVSVLLCTRHIRPHHSVSTCSCHSMHTAHPSPPLCFNVFLSFYAPGTSIPTTLFQRVPVILCNWHIHSHHSVSTCSCHSMHTHILLHHSVSTCSSHSMHPAHPSPPLCFNVFLSFYAPGTSVPTTLFQRVPVILCTRHIHPHHSVSHVFLSF